MDIIFQLGVHCTDEGRLVRSLLRSRGALVAQGVSVPMPRRYRSVLRETLNALAGQPAPPELQEALIDGLVEDEAPRRVVFCHESLICMPQRAVAVEGLYPTAPQRLRALRGLFPDHRVECHLALCNPAILVPTLALRAGPDGYETVTDGARAERLSWLQTVRAILTATPGLSLTLWCNEDTPLIWPEILRTLTDVGPDVALEGDLDLATALLSDAGLAALQADLAGLDRADLAGRRSLTSQALERHGRTEEMEIAVDLPGWSETLIERITDRYIADCAAIAALPGVRFIAP